MPKKKIIKGSVRYDSDTDYSEVVEITGNLDCYGADTKTSFPKLTTIGSYLDCNGADTKAAFPKLTTIGGSLYCNGADTKAAFPKLTTTGGGSGKALRLVRAALKRKGFFLFDGVLSTIKNTRKFKNGSKVHKITIVGQTKTSFCIELDGKFAHGDTLKEAKESLIYKIKSRDKTAYENWTVKKLITKREAIKSYRVITGACESGTRHFVESLDKTKSKYKVSEVIELTKNQYGNANYEAFFIDKRVNEKAN